MEARGLRLHDLVDRGEARDLAPGPVLDGNAVGAEAIARSQRHERAAIREREDRLGLDAAAADRHEGVDLLADRVQELVEPVADLLARLARRDVRGRRLLARRRRALAGGDENQADGEHELRGRHCPVVRNPRPAR
jgi:hypothetical protein